MFMAFELGGIFIVTHCCDTGPRCLRSCPKDRLLLQVRGTGDLFLNLDQQWQDSPNTGPTGATRRLHTSTMYMYIKWMQGDKCKFNKHLKVHVEAESELQLCPVQLQGEDQGSLCATLVPEI